MAIGFLKTLCGEGIRILRGVSVVQFDDIACREHSARLAQSGRSGVSFPCSFSVDNKDDAAFVAAIQRWSATVDRLRDVIAAADAAQQSFRRSDDPRVEADADHPDAPASFLICPGCSGRMRVVETFARGVQPRTFTAEPAGVDWS